MLKAIFDALSSIGNFFSTIFDFVLSLVEDIVYIIQLVGDTVSNIPSYFAWLPAGVVAILVGAFAIVVIYKIMGRD